MNSDFFNWITTWNNNLLSLDFASIGNAEQIAIVSVDMVVGFCHQGPLASREVHNIIPQVVDVFKRAKDYGIKHFLLLQDTHAKNAEEFNAYPPHCVKGTEESQNIPEIAQLPFSNLYTTFEKNALSPIYDTKINDWLVDHEKVTSYIIVGDCTDLCVYNMAMNARMQANAFNLKRRVIVPANAVATYDLSVEKAKELNALPHPAEFLHRLFLYHMALNAIEVVQSVA